MPIITVSSRGRIPYLGKIGPIGTPIEVTAELYQKLVESGVQVTVVEADAVETSVNSADIAEKIEEPKVTSASMMASVLPEKETKDDIPEAAPVNQKNAQNLSRKQRKKLNAEMRRQNASAIVEEKGAQAQDSSSSTKDVQPVESKESADVAAPEKKDTAEDA